MVLATHERLCFFLDGTAKPLGYYTLTLCEWGQCGFAESYSPRERATDYRQLEPLAGEQAGRGNRITLGAVYNLAEIGYQGATRV